MNALLLTVQLRYEQDVVQARQRARQIAALLDFTGLDQTAIATSVSEVARNALGYGGGGRVEFSISDESDRAGPGRSALLIRVIDKGPGISNLPEILAGQYQSQTGMGLGIVGARRLSDFFDIQSAPGQGTAIELGKLIPNRPARLDGKILARISADLAQQPPRGPLEEMQHQNKELLAMLDAMQHRNAEVERLNSELDETNRGVLALYAELDDKALSLRKASELKSRFLSDLTHELRTPLNAIVSLSGLLIDRLDGPLTSEQEKQVRFIRRSAENLSDMVNDLLDLAKIEAGKTELHLAHFTIGDVMATLRGVFRTLFSSEQVTLSIEDPPEPIEMFSDESRLSQILRNFVSNAMKFTERGQVRVWAQRLGEDQISISVRDTGIGIAPQDQARVFEDYAQVDGPVQRRVRGTGLGLPLTRKLATLLGGSVSLQSTVGEGSTFTVTLPMNAQAVQAKEESVSAIQQAGQLELRGAGNG